MPRLSAQETDSITSLLSKSEESSVQERLSKWEEEFLASVAEQFANTSWLSEKQIDRLREIVEGTGRGTSGEGSRPISRPKKLSSVQAKLQGPIVEDFPALMEKAQKINPAVTIDEIVRQIFDLGKRKLNANIARGILQEPRPSQTGT